ncbi:MAG TPA: MotA/TolQ/ExbB proton channel family protein [Polyangia bacterium]|nr:MotA/TolQ/ExbB proton channel family protein [Polyangia bacterium]
MHATTSTFVHRLLEWPLFQSEWVFWLLFALSASSVAVILERAIFFRRHAPEPSRFTATVEAAIGRGDYEAAARALTGRRSLEARVLLAGLCACDQGPDAVEELLAGALGAERARFEARLAFLATLASNAPYIGLFGTVLGIVRAFRNLGADLAEAHAGVMTALAEALVATAIGLLVAIPAVVAFNAFKNAVKVRTTRAETLSRTLLSRLKGELPVAETQVASLRATAAAE